MTVVGRAQRGEAVHLGGLAYETFDHLQTEHHRLLRSFLLKATQIASIPAIIASVYASLRTSPILSDLTTQHHASQKPHNIELALHHSAKQRFRSRNLMVCQSILNQRERLRSFTGFHNALMKLLETLLEVPTRPHCTRTFHFLLSRGTSDGFDEVNFRFFPSPDCQTSRNLERNSLVKNHNECPHNLPPAEREVLVFMAPLTVQRDSFVMGPKVVVVAISIPWRLASRS